VPGRGYVKVHAIPWAMVTIDDATKIETPDARAIDLEEGRHRLRFVHDGFAPIEREIEVVSGAKDAAIPVIVDFCKVGKPTKPVDGCGASP
jgi:hypothetical protein